MRWGLQFLKASGVLWALCLCCAGVPGVAAAQGFWGEPENWAEILGAGRAGLDGLPRLSEIDNALAPEDAYALQLQMFPLLEPAGRAGFKAGLTSELARLRLGVDAPVAGMLPRRGVYRSGAAVVSRDGMVVEAELGFRLRRALSVAPESVEDLLPLIDGCHPVVELPLTRFSGTGRPRLVDLIGANAGADRVVVGPAQRLSDWTELEGVFVSVTRDGRRWQLGKAMNVEPSPLETLLWLVKTYTALGVTILPDDLLLTGTMIPPDPAQPGLYEVDFRELGRVSFRVEATD